MGTALKTLSLRIRGVKTELEEAGLETEGMAETTATLQAKLNALTHGKVDILLDADTFKNTTQILREMADVWEEMTDMEQAAALELLGGKRQANILSSLISNFQTVEDVIETSMNSSGSAMAENAKWMDSIEGKSQQLANSMQALWNDTINSEVIKYFYDVAQGITEAIHAFGPWKSALTGVMVYFAAFKKITPKALFSDITANIKNYAAAMQQVSSIKSLGFFGTTASGALNASSITAYTNALKGMSAQQQAAILTSQGLEKAHIAQVLAQNGVNDSTIQTVVGYEALIAAKAQSISMTGAEIQTKIAEQGATLSATAAKWLEDHATEELTRDKLMAAGATGQEIMALLGLTGAATGAAASLKAVGLALKTMIVGNPIGFILTIISTVAMLAPLFEDVFKSAEEKLKDLESEWKTLSETINTASNDFKTLKSSADDVIPRFAELAKGVDQFGNNVKLTDEEYKEFLSLNNQIAEMFPEINNGMDSNGNAMLSLSLTANTLEESLWSLVEAERAAANEEIAKTMPDVLSNIDSTVQQYGKQIENTKSELSALETYYNKILNGESITATGAKNKVEIQNILDSLGANYSISEDNDSYVMEYEFAVDNSNLAEIKRNYENAAAGIKKEIENINQKIANKWSQLNPVITAWTQTDYTYQGLSDEMQKIVQGLIGNVDFSQKDLDKQEEVQNYIKTNIINPIDGASYDVQKAITNMFLAAGGVDDQGKLLDVEQYKRAVEQFKNDIQTLDFVGDKSLILELFGLGGKDMGGTDIDKAIEHTENILKDSLGNLSQEAQDYINQLSTDEVLYIKAKVSADLSELSVEELQKEINKTYEFNISDFKSQITGMSDSISTYQEALQKLEKGSFTLSDFMELIEDMPELAKGVDLSSNAFYGLASNLRGAIKTSTKSLISDLKTLKYRLVDAGKSTTAIDQLIESIENMPEDALDGVIDKYGTLADEIDRALTKQNLLSAAMEEEPEGYETRGEAMEYMKGKLEEGKIGSESNVWNVAAQYGFTSDEEDLNKRADALAKFIAVRERWFKEADDGDDRTDDGYSFEGIENFIKDVETAADKIDELQWTYDETTGVLNFDFDKKNLDAIVQSLSKTEQFAGLTKEEFMDMVKWIGQYYNINWSDNQDILDDLNGIATSANDAKTKLEEYGAAMQKYLGVDTTIDLTTQPTLSQDKMQVVNNKDKTKSIVVTPILPNGKELTSEELKTYAEKLLNGEEIDPSIDIKLATFEGADAEKQAQEYKATLSKALSQYNQLQDTLGISTTIDTQGIEGLKKIEEIQKTITTNTDGLTIIDREAFTEALEEAGYTEEKIGQIIDKIRELDKVSLNGDPFNLYENMDDDIDNLSTVKELQEAIKKDAKTGWTVVDIDLFTSILEEAGYTKKEIDEVIKKIQEYQKVIAVQGNEDPLGLNNTITDVDTLKNTLNALGIKFADVQTLLGNGRELKINVSDLVTTLKDKGWSEEQIRTYCTKLSEVDIPGFTIEVGQEEIDAAIEKANEVPEEKKIDVQVTGTAETDLQRISDRLDQITGTKTIDIVTNETVIKTTKTSPTASSVPTSAAQSGASGDYYYDPITKKWRKKFANGTAHASGSAHADGNWGLQQSEHNALVGELGAELVWKIARYLFNCWNILKLIKLQHNPQG